MYREAIVLWWMEYALFGMAMLYYIGASIKWAINEYRKTKDPNRM